MNNSLSIQTIREAAAALAGVAHTTPLDGWTYQGYARNNLAQAKAAWSGTGFDELLKAARHVRAGALF